MKRTIALADDHQLFLKSLEMMLLSFNQYEVVATALNGQDLQGKVKSLKTAPDIFLIDVSMPVMDGFATAQWLATNCPASKLVALSMDDNDNSIIAMIKAGCCAYLLKDTHPNELERALEEIYTKGFYNGDASNINYRRLLLAEARNEEVKLSDKEKEFIKQVCSDLTYKQIAAIMKISERSVDSLRESLFQKLNVQSRVGMALEALRRGFATL